MSRLQKFLVVALLLELFILATDWRLLQRIRLLPPVDWNAGLVDEHTAKQIQAQERRLDPSSAISWVRLGSTYRAFGMFPQAEYCYRQGDHLSPADRGYLYLWAECFSLLGQTAEATKLYRQIIDEKLTAPLGAETTAYCWLNIGQDYLREENVPAAIDALSKAGDIPKAQFLESRVLIRSGRAREAIVLLDQLLTNAPNVLDYVQMKSWAEAELGNQDAADDYYERSLRTSAPMEKKDPTFYTQTLKLQELSYGFSLQLESLHLKQQGKLKEALSAIRKAIDATWTEDRAVIEAKIELELGHYQKAIDIAEHCRKLAGASAAILDAEGVSYARLGNMPKARSILEQMASFQANAHLYQQLSSLAADLDQSQQYSSLREYSIGKDIWVTNSLSEDGLKQALEHFEAATKLYAGDAHPWFYMAEALRFLGDAAGAEAAYRQCLQVDPDFGRALRGLDRLKSHPVRAGVGAELLQRIPR